MTETEKKVELIALYARINAAIDIEKEFDQLFRVLDLIPSRVNAVIEKRDVVNVLKTFKDMQIFRGAKDGICDKKGEPI